MNVPEWCQNIGRWALGAASGHPRHAIWSKIAFGFISDAIVASGGHKPNILDVFDSGMGDFYKNKIVNQISLFIWVMG